MAISEQIGYPDYILEEEDQKLDQEYMHVSSKDSLHIICSCHLNRIGACTQAIALLNK